jgi:hypothetical protein
MISLLSYSTSLLNRIFVTVYINSAALSLPHPIVSTSPYPHTTYYMIVLCFEFRILNKFSISHKYHYVHYKTSCDNS